MSADVRIIGNTGLEVGQWIQFFTNQDLSKAATEQATIYQPEQRFLVISQEDPLFDLCRCTLADIEGKIYDYAPKKHSPTPLLNLTPLVEKGEIRVVSQSSVESIHGTKKVAFVYQVADKYIKQAADYFADYPAEFLGQSTSSVSKARAIRRLNETLEAQASQPQQRCQRS